MKIIIHYYEFPISAPYTAGHVLTEIEAQVLNAQRADNIRTKVEFWVKAAEEESDEEILSLTDLTLLEEKVANLDSTYEFSSFLPRNRRGLLQREKEIVAGNIAAENGDDASILLCSRDPRIESEARRRLNAKLGVLKPEDIGI